MPAPPSRRLSPLPPLLEDLPLMPAEERGRGAEAGAEGERGCVRCKHGKMSVPVVEAGRIFLVHVSDARLCASAPVRLWAVADAYGWRNVAKHVCERSIKLRDLVAGLRSYEPSSPAERFVVALTLYALSGHGAEEAARWAVSVTPSEVYAATHPRSEALARGVLAGDRSLLDGIADQRDSLSYADVDVGRLALAERVLLAAYEVDRDDPLGAAERILREGGLEGCTGLCARWLAPALGVDRRLVEEADRLCSPVRCALLQRHGSRGFRVYATLLSEAAAIVKVLGSRAAEPLSPAALRGALEARLMGLRRRYGEAYVLIFERTPLKIDGVAEDVWKKIVDLAPRLGGGGARGEAEGAGWEAGVEGVDEEGGV